MAKLIEKMVRFCVKFGSALIKGTKVPSLKKNKYHKFQASKFCFQTWKRKRGLEGMVEGRDKE
jgi:hypothetical protein